MSADRAVRQMRQLLEDERDALIKGELSRLDKLLKRKGALIERLEERPLPAAELDSLRTLLRRNQSLASAARDGIKAVSARIEGLSKGVPSGTYGANGVRTDIAGPRRTLAKRA